MGDREEKDRAGSAATPREREATSDETLDDIDRTEDATVDSPGDSSAGGGETSAPSPDGSPDAGGGGERADGGEAGGPM